MKKICALLIAVSMLLGMSLNTAVADDTSAFLIMVYLCGTDLESDGGAATGDLYEMLQAELEDEGDITLIVQAGGTETWQCELLESGESSRFIISDDVYNLDEGLGQLDMGDKQTLADFVSYGLDNFAAKRNALIMWDHGSGATGGLCYDEITGNSLKTNDIYDALSVAMAGRSEKLAFIGFDACLMSTYEVAAHMAPFAEYMVASEELEPGSGWVYNEFLGALQNDPNMDTESLCKKIVDSFISVALSEDPDDYVTLAVTDLSKIDALTQAVGAVGNDLSAVLASGELATISRACAKMRAFGDFCDAGSDMVDILQVASALKDIAPEASKALTTALKQAVVYTKSSDNIDSAGGLSILIPNKTKQSADEYLPHYDPLKLMPSYASFVEGYLTMLAGGSYHFTQTAVSSCPIGATEEETPAWFTSFVQTVGQSGGFGSGATTEDPGYEMSQSDYQQAAEAYGDQAHVVVLSDDDMANLSYVEASLMQDALELVDDDYGDEVYFDFGLIQDVYIDWEKNTIYGLFDGNWPTLEGQMVPMYDQIVTEGYTRSLIPAMINDKEQYLLVVFNDANPGGAVVGYTEGYDDNGNPARGQQKLKAGDKIIPLYDLIYWDEKDEQQTDTYEGDQIVMGNQPLTFGYEAVEPGDYTYAFCLNDIFGEYDYSDFVELSFN